MSRKQIRTSLLFSFAEKYTLLLLGTGGSMWIARLLTPADIGLYSVGAVLVGLAQTVRDFGVGPYLIQEKELSLEKMRAAMGVSIAVAWLLALLIVLASVPLAAFYHEPRLRNVLLVLALNFLMLPFGAIVLPCLRRALRFSAIYLINVVHGVVNLAVSVTLAMSGYGAMSLAWAAVAATLAALLASLGLRPAGVAWRPGLKGARSIVAFGLFSTGGGLVDEAGVAAPDLIIGKMTGIEAVGLFGKANGTLNIFNQAITSAVSPVIFPLFAAKARDGGDAGAAYMDTVAYVTALSWPFFAFLALMALPLVELLYGPQWHAAAPLIRVMCLSSALYSMFSMSRYLFVAKGHVKAQARLDVLAVTVRIVALILAAPFGLRWLAWAVVAGLFFRCYLCYRHLFLLTGLRGIDLLLVARKSAGLCVLSAIVPGLVLWHAGGDAGLAPLQLVLAASGAFLGWVAGLVLLRHPITGELGALRRAVSGFSFDHLK